MTYPELLSPASNFEALKAVINAGADAIYLGGNEFGARAYAENFSQEELLQGIDLAHKFNKKIYLTLNTLVKEREFQEAVKFLKPFADNGLDAVIVQDVGIMKMLRDEFKNIELHVSTQASITGNNSAKFFKELGATRIVPAREMTLEEIKTLKNNVDIEIETFIHGAMCYCYSGRCLLSSFLGGRSGNRGRCAQPCRLPYQLSNHKEKRELYPLSMKDMCTIDILDKLIDAGIDSFKIEGRMKKPEYAAGVTSVYRKYMDLYFENGKIPEISKEDYEVIDGLYIRKEREHGYYFLKNGKLMITMNEPGYSSQNKEVVEKIQKEYLSVSPKVPVNFEIKAYNSEPLQIRAYTDQHEKILFGQIIQKAINCQTDEQSIRKQINKLGNTDYKLNNCTIYMDDNIFISVKEINELRRNILLELDEEYKKSASIIHKNGNEDNVLKRNERETNFCISQKIAREKKNKISIHVLTMTVPQIRAAISLGIERIYIDISTFLKYQVQIYSLFNSDTSNLYISMPYIFRYRNSNQLEEIETILNDSRIKGVLIHDYEMLGYVNSMNYLGDIVCDAEIYTFNRNAFEVIKKYANEVYLPYELTKHEIDDMEVLNRSSISVYGHLPMMVTANCIAKTFDMKCDNLKQNDESMLRITDRKNTNFYVYRDCKYCYNVIYNSVPLCLNKFKRDFIDFKAVRLNFTDEDEKETLSIIKLFRSDNLNSTDLLEGYTLGHYVKSIL